MSEGQTPIIFPQKRIERSGSDISEIDEELQRPKSSSHLNIVWILLIAYSLFLVYNAVLHNQDGNMANTPLWNFQDSQQLLAFIGDLVLRGFCKFAYFIPVGLMATLIFASLLVRFRQFRGAVSEYIRSFSASC